MDFKEIIKYLRDSGIEVEIDDNPSEEKIKEIKEKMAKYNAKFPITDKK